MRSRALGAVTAQAVQAGISFVLQVLVARWLGVEELGRFAILYGLIVLAAAVVSGFVGDTLVVLDRGTARIRSALQGSTLLLTAGSALAGAVAMLAVGLITPFEAAAFAAALALFAIEEVARRLLMAGYGFFRVAAADLTGFAVALAIVGGVEVAGGATLLTFLLAIAAGQLAAIATAMLLLPREERRVVRFHRGGYREVAGFGTWRGLQQLLRPGLLTVLRFAIGAAAGLAAVGLVEAARVYTAPAMLIVGGLTSYLFVDYARDRETPIGRRIRRADLAVVVLLTLTAVLGVIALALLGWAGPLLFGVELDPVAVLAWLTFAASVAAVTPWGSLAAVSGRQATVFAIRAADTVVSALAVIIAALLGVDPSLLPFLLAAGSLLGGLAIRLGVLTRVQPAG